MLGRNYEIQSDGSRVSVKGRMRKFLRQWKQINDPQFVLETIEFGYKLPLLTIPPREYLGTINPRWTSDCLWKKVSTHSSSVILFLSHLFSRYYMFVTFCVPQPSELAALQLSSAGGGIRSLFSTKWVFVSGGAVFRFLGSLIVSDGKYYS